MDNNGSAIMLLLDDKSKRECDLNISELLDNDINIIESLDEINSDLINQGNRTLIILEKFPEIEGSISDLKLYKYAFNLDVRYIGTDKLYLTLMEDVAICYKISLQELNYTSLTGVINNDSAILETYEIDKDKFVFETDRIKSKLEFNGQYTEDVSLLYETLMQVFNYAMHKNSQVNDLKKRVEQLEKINNSNSNLVDKVYTELLRLIEEEGDRSKALEQYECILSKDTFETFMASDYSRRPVVIYFKQYTKLNYLDEMIFTLYNACRQHLSLRCKMVKFYDSNASIETQLQPYFYKYLKNNYNETSIDVNDFICKFGDYKNVIDYLLTNKIGVDVLFVFDLRSHDKRFIDGCDVTFDMIQDIRDVKRLKKNIDVVVSNSKESKLSWNPSKFDIENISSVDSLYRLTSQKVIQNTLASVNMALGVENE